MKLFYYQEVLVLSSYFLIYTFTYLHVFPKKFNQNKKLCQNFTENIKDKIFIKINNFSVHIVKKQIELKESVRCNKHITKFLINESIKI